MAYHQDNMGDAPANQYRIRLGRIMKFVNDTNNDTTYQFATQHCCVIALEEA